MKVSVVVPTYNLKDELIECINSLKKQSVKPFEIIVVDNGSTDGTKETVEKAFPEVKYIRSEKNLGVAGGRNLGIKNASEQSDYILFFDHDMVADEKMLENLLRVSEKSGDIGITTAKIYYWEDQSVVWAAGTGVNLLSGQIIFYGGKDRGQYDKVRNVQVAPAVILTEKEVLEKIKKFDEIYVSTYEDTDFCFRAKRAGFRTVYVPDAIAFHKIPLEATMATKRLLSRAYYVSRNRIIFMKRFGKNFFLFLLFLPGYFVYYSFLCLRFKKLASIVSYARGTLTGLFLVLKGEA